MPRKARMEFEGAVYHMMDRGNRMEAVFLDDEERRLFLKTLWQACARTGWRIHSYVLMGNHYHLLMETPEPNLSSGMQWLQATYSRPHDEAEAERLIRKGLQTFGMKDLDGHTKGAR